MALPTAYWVVSTSSGRTLPRHPYISVTPPLVLQQRPAALSSSTTHCRRGGEARGGSALPTPPRQ